MSTFTTPDTLTAAERIINLFDHLWPIPKTHFHVRKDTQGDRVTIQILSNDFMTVYARVYFTPKGYVPAATSGYEIEVSFSGFNGTLQESVPFLEALTAVQYVVRQMQITALIRGE